MKEKKIDEIFRNKHFSHSLNGYNPKQVDRFINKVEANYRSVFDQYEVLKAKLEEFERQEKYFRKALVRSEEAYEEIKQKGSVEAEEIIRKAKHKADKIIDSAQKEAEQVKHKAQLEGIQFIDNVKQNQSLYEDETKKLIHSLYYRFRHALNNLEEELIQEVDQYTDRLAENFTESSIEPPALDGLGRLKSADKWTQKEEALLVGCKLKEDIKDKQGTTLFAKNTIVTPAMIKEIIDQQIYGELLEAINDGDKESVK